MRPKRNLAARAGRWSAENRKKAIFGWLAFVIAAVVIGGMVGTETQGTGDTGPGESGRADAIAERAFPEKASETVLIQSKRLRADDPRFKAGVADVVKRLEAIEPVANVESPYKSDGAISADQHSALVGFDMPGDTDKAEESIEKPLAAVAAAQKAHPELRIAESGDASIDKAVSKSFESDFAKAEYTSLPLTLIILVLAFGALMAAGVPVLLALSAVAATIGVLGPISQLAPVEESISSVILLIGLAVGVDYALFYLRREREERAAGRGERAALEAAAATSGRAVLVSGATVMIAMAGMYIAGESTFTSFATGTIIVVAMAMIGSVTVLPALLSVLGDRVDKGRIPLLHRLRARRSGREGMWSRIVEGVLRRPRISVALSVGLLVALALPVLGMKTALPGMDSLSRDIPEMQTYDRTQQAFPTEHMPASVVIEASDVRDGPAAGAIDDLRDRAERRGDLFEGRGSVDVSRDGTVAQVDLPVRGDGTDARSNRALDELRGAIVPETVGQVSGVEAGVTGMTAGTRDFNDSMKSSLPFVFLFVGAAAFVLLLLTFRSLVIPLKAIALNLLSVAAAYGLLVAVFQHGVGAGLLGVEQTGPITAWLPLFLFVVLFGLSMDYHVFILSRIRESVDGGMRTEAAIAHGIKSTAGVVTSAAVVMVGVFGVFGTLSSVEFKQMGVGLAAAILLDATIVRAVLLPAAMKLLGEWNWWLPQSLRWLPEVSHGGEVEPARA